jgi:hypothetical protein
VGYRELKQIVLSSTTRRAANDARDSPTFALLVLKMQTRDHFDKFGCGGVGMTARRSRNLQCPVLRSPRVPGIFVST